jgi:hypothetical protein
LDDNQAQSWCCRECLDMDTSEILKWVPKKYHDFIWECPECVAQEEPGEVFKHLVLDHEYTVGQAKESLDYWLDDMEAQEVYGRR